MFVAFLYVISMLLWKKRYGGNLTYAQLNRRITCVNLFFVTGYKHKKRVLSEVDIKSLHLCYILFVNRAKWSLKIGRRKNESMRVTL